MDSKDDNERGEEKWEEVEDDEAPPRPPEMIAASVVGEKADIIEDGDAAPVPGQQAAASVEVHGDEEEKREEEVDDEEAPRPPEMLAASFVDDADQEAKKRPPESEEDIEETPPATRENREILLDPSSSLNRPISTTANMRASAISITPIPRGGDEPSLPVETTISPAQESMPPPRPNLDRNYQSLPLLEATLVDDEVYDAFPVSDDHGWSRRTRKYMILGLVSFGFATVAAVTGVAVMSKGNQNEGTELDVVPDPQINTTIPNNTFVMEVWTNIPPAGPSMWNQQVQAIAGNVSGDGLGYTVALSADGKTLAAASVYSNNYTGYVVVYTVDKDGGNMTQLGQTIYGNATLDSFGDSVDFSSDGKFLAIGSPGDVYNFDRPGYVQVYTLEISDGLGYMWKQLGQTITGEGDGDNFGGSVSLSGDGKTLAVGAEDNDGFAEDAGRVKIYHLDDDGTSWKQLGQDIDGESATDRSGYSVSLSADGTTVVIGAPYSHNYGDYSGLVRVYRIDTGRSTWEKLGQTIFGSVEDVFGQSVDISSDGNILAIGGDGEYVGVYKLENSSSWKQLGQNINGEAVDDRFGRSLSLSEDGKTLAVGAWSNDGHGDESGHVRVYRIDDSGSNLTQIGEDIDGEAACDFSGWSLSLSADGKTVAIGSDGADDNGLDYSGHVRVFVRE